MRDMQNQSIIATDKINVAGRVTYGELKRFSGLAPNP